MLKRKYIRNVGLYVTDKQYKKLLEIAENNSVTISTVLRMLIDSITNVEINYAMKKREKAIIGR